MAGNSSLAKAKDARQDEFYTQLTDIEKELRHYRRHFQGKTVLCNCDDPFESNFFKYFALNFNRLGLKKLMATCYSGSPITGTQLSLFGTSSNGWVRGPARPVACGVHPSARPGYGRKDVLPAYRAANEYRSQVYPCAVALASLSVMQSTRFPARRSTWPAANSTTLSGSWISPREAATSVAASPLIS